MINQNGFLVLCRPGNTWPSGTCDATTSTNVLVMMEGIDRFAIIKCTSANPYSISGCSIVDIYGYPGSDTNPDPTLHDFTNGRAYRLSQYTTPRSYWLPEEWNIDRPEDASDCSPGDRSDQSSKTSKSSKSSKQNKAFRRRTHRNLSASVAGASQHKNLRRG